MPKRYELKIEKGTIPTGDHGLDLYNRMINEQFDEEESETKRDLSQEYRLLRNGFSIIPYNERHKPRLKIIQRIKFMGDDYFLETRTDTNGAKEFLFYDDEFKIIVRSADINEIVGLLISV